MRCDTKRAIWRDLYNKHISIFCIKHMSIIFRTLQVNKWWSKNQTFFSYNEINATQFGNKNYIHLDSTKQFQYWCYIATNVCSRKIYYFWWSPWLLKELPWLASWCSQFRTQDAQLTVCDAYKKMWWLHMMTSSNGNIFRVTGHLRGEFTGPRWIPRTKASDAELWCFLWSALE